MRLRLRSFLLTSALSFIPSLASATTISGLYVDGGAGYNLVQDQHVHANSPADGSALPKFTVNHGTGYTGFGAIGWGFGNGLRVEAEGLYNFSHDSYTSYKRDTEPGHTVSGLMIDTQTLQTPNGKLVGTNGVYQWVPNHENELPAGGWQWNNSKNEWQFIKGFPSSFGMPFTGGFSYSNPTSSLAPGQGWIVQEPNGSTFASNSISVSEAEAHPDYTYALEGQQYMVDGSPVSFTSAAYETLIEHHLLVSNNNTCYSQNGLPITNILYTKGAAGFAAEGGVLNCAYLAHIMAWAPHFHRRGKYVTTVPNGVWSEYIPPNTSQVALNHHGSDESWGGFANVLYDFDLERLFGLKSIVAPFVGGGAGYLWQRYNRPNTMIAAITGTHGGFAWQGIAGVAFDTGISGLQITAQYRMIGQPGSFYNGAFNYGTEGGHANFDQRFNHQFIVGFRYAFHNQSVPIQAPPVPRPIVAAAPAPVPARSYLVFFDWNQYALTSRARQIVVEAAHATSYVHTTRINVNGYTDSSAAPGLAGQKYNYALSVKRAKSVEAELIRNGVPASEIVIRGYGDTNPLVPTAPNTREPQNRRVEIILHA